MKKVNQKKPHKVRIKAGSKWALWTNTKRDHTKHTMAKEDNKKLEFEIGNLQVQIAEYQQIIHELSEKLKLYEHKYGSVFKATNQTHNN